MSQKIELEREVLNILLNLFSKNVLVNVIGSSGTGKSSLVLYLVGKLLTSQKPYNGQVVWVQTSKQYPKIRMLGMFKHDINATKYIQKNIFIIPKRPHQFYEDLERLIKRIVSEEIFLPPYTKYIVIDNISHHLRYRVSKSTAVKDTVFLLNSFFKQLLQPLIIFCKMNNKNLILTHEITYVPAINQEKMFYYKLYERLDSGNIYLKKKFGSKDRILKIPSDNLEKVYSIQGSGFCFK